MMKGMRNIWFSLVGFNQRLGNEGFFLEALTGASLLLGAFGIGQGQEASRQAGEAAKKTAEKNIEINKIKREVALANARIARENAVVAKQRAEITVRGIQREGRQLESAQRAVIGASGVTTAGSAGDIISEGKAVTAEDVMITRMLGEDEARGFLEEGLQFQAEAQIFKIAKEQAAGEVRSAGRLAKARSQSTLITGGSKLLLQTASLFATPSGSGGSSSNTGVSI